MIDISRYVVQLRRGAERVLGQGEARAAGAVRHPAGDQSQGTVSQWYINKTIDGVAVETLS